MVRPLIVPNPKLTMQFNGGSNGWSESHFYTSQVPISNFSLQSAAQQLCLARCECLDGVQSRLFAAVLSLDNVSHDSADVDISGIIPDPVHGYAGIGGPDPSNTGAWSFQTVHVSWRIRLNTTNAQTNPNEYIAGMPASDGQTGPYPYNDSAPTVASFLDKYMALLVGGPWGALGRSWSNGPYPIDGINFVAQGATSPARFQINLSPPFPAAFNFPIGGYVRMNGTTYTSPQKRLRLNGTYIIANYDVASGIVTVNVPRVLVAPTFTGFGELDTATAEVFQYTSFAYKPITHRKRGKPFGGGRGRR